MKALDRSHVLLTGAFFCVFAACNQGGLQPPAIGSPDASVAGSCANLIGTPAEIAATPRTRGDLELVALTLDSDRFTVVQSTYDRVFADFEAMAALNSDIATSWAPFTPPGTYMDGRTLFLRPDPATYASIEAGTYTAWDCLNRYYQLTEVDAFQGIVSVVLKGNYNLRLLEDLYRGLPGVTNVSSLDSLGQVGDNAHLCASRSGDQYQYAMMAAYGDCPSGCTYHKLYCYTSSAPGAAALIADPTECAQWYAQFCQP